MKQRVKGILLCVLLTLVAPAYAYYLGAPDAAHAHAARRHEGIPSIARDPATGRLWAVWYGGVTPREDSNNYLMVATSDNDGDTWKEVLVYDPDGSGPVRAFDPEMWVSPDGKLQLTWTERTVPVAEKPANGKWDAGQLAHLAGHDDRALASSDRLMMLTLDASKEPCAPYPVPRQIGTGVMMCKPILGPKGEWFFPVSIWWTKESAGLLVSEDGGKTFTRRGGATIAKEQGQTFDEHSIVLMKDGSIRSWIRTDKGAMESCSKDGGRTWSPIEAGTFANTPTRRVVARLASGNLLLVKNGDRPDANQGRKNLTAYVSDDEGRTWKGGLLLDARSGATYPDFALGSDGTIYAVWDHYRTGDREILFGRFTEADVRTGRPVSPQTKIGVTVTSRYKWPEAKVRGIERHAMEAVANLALVPPKLTTAPVPAKYQAANEVYAMNNGAALTPKGRLWASWIGGGDSPDAYTVCAFSDDNGETWGKPALVVDGHDPKRIPFPRSNIIANLWTDPVGKLHLFVSQSMWHNDGRMGVWETVCTNPDDAKPVWSPIRRLCDGAALNKPIVLRNGTWLLPVEIARTWGPWSGLFGTSSKEGSAFALASTDGGKTWMRRGCVTVPDSDWPENHFLELKDGTIRMYARSVRGLRMTESRDEGRTWGEVTKPEGMDQPCARCQVRALASGNWIFVKHLSPPDSYNDNKRFGLIAYLSRDEGRTWEGGLVLDDRRSVSYPDVEQGPDGLIYVTHDFERSREAEIILHRFTEEDILAKKFLSPKSRKGIVVTKAMGTKHNQKK